MSAEESTDRMQPKLRAQAIEVYDRMHAEASTNDDGSLIWTGAFVRLTEEIGVAVGSYQKLRQKLEHSGCITFVQRGNGFQTSLIRLNHSPDTVEWSSARGRNLTGTVDAATLRQEIEDVKRRIGTLDVVAVLVSLSEDNKDLHQKITKTEITIRRLAEKMNVEPSDIGLD